MESKNNLFLIVARESYLNSSWIDLVDDPNNPQYYGEKINEYDGEYFVKYDSPFTYEEIKDNHTTRSLIEIDNQQLPLLLNMIDNINNNGVEGCTTYLYAYKVKWDDFDLDEENVGFDKNNIILEDNQIWYNGTIYSVKYKKHFYTGSLTAWMAWKELELPNNEIHNIY